MQRQSRQVFDGAASFARAGLEPNTSRPAGIKRRLSVAPRASLAIRSHATRPSPFQIPSSPDRARRDLISSHLIRIRIFLIMNLEGFRRAFAAGGSRPASVRLGRSLSARRTPERVRVGVCSTSLGSPARPAGETSFRVMSIPVRALVCAVVSGVPWVGGAGGLAGHAGVIVCPRPRPVHAASSVSRSISRSSCLSSSSR